jgi:hypothetical protein
MLLFVSLETSGVTQDVAAELDRDLNSWNALPPLRHVIAILALQTIATQVIESETISRPRYGKEA